MKKLGKIQQLDDDEEEFQSMNRNNTKDASKKEEKPGFSMKNLAQVGVGLGALAVGGYAFWQASKMNNEEIIPNVVENDDQLRKKLDKINKDARDFPVVGFKCFWTESESRSPIVLIAISSHKGESILISLDKFPKFPQELRIILENSEIVKSRFEINKETGYLFEDHGLGVYSTFDLRYLAKDTGHHVDTISKLAASVLDVGLGPEIKEWSSVTPRHQNYAENYVETSMNLFKTLYSFVGRPSTKSEVLKYCHENLNKKFIIKDL